MKTCVFAATLGLLALLPLQTVGQLGNDRRWTPPPPEMAAKFKRAADACARGEAFLEKRELEKAIAAFRETIAVEAEIGGFVSSGHYYLAQALTLAGRTEEALEAYRGAVKWEPKRKVLHVNGPGFVEVLADYAMLLAQSGKLEEAKAVYYDLLRQYVNESLETFPFLVVFDPDPGMTQWELTPENLVAAAKMIRAPGKWEEKALLEEVRRMAPDWVTPIVHQALGSSDEKRVELLALAERLARTDEERGWVREYLDWDRQYAGDVKSVPKLWELRTKMARIGAARRKASVALQEALRDLEQNHHKVAAGKG